ncbi:hypothetical protein [Candidatus Poriferisocius sp.]|uniref:hypothetical protein n=1 Tax=Candidatus Poriferisocius sp. TaxID=3101276 RepID=UPI003B014AD7
MTRSEPMRPALRFGKYAVVAVAVAVLASALVAVGPVGAQTLADVGVRDRLITEQEALLDVYRCRFAVDVGEVGGGCAGGAPAAPACGAGGVCRCAVGPRPRGA